jgi:hypothetical protein
MFLFLFFFCLISLYFCNVIVIGRIQHSILLLLILIYTSYNDYVLFEKMLICILYELVLFVGIVLAE